MVTRYGQNVLELDWIMYHSSTKIGRNSHTNSLLAVCLSMYTAQCSPKKRDRYSVAMVQFFMFVTISSKSGKWCTICMNNLLHISWSNMHTGIRKIQLTNVKLKRARKVHGLRCSEHWTLNTRSMDHWQTIELSFLQECTFSPGASSLLCIWMWPTVSAKLETIYGDWFHSLCKTSPYHHHHHHH